ncbi:MAG: response regulator, partial [Hylemonella sp.]
MSVRVMIVEDEPELRRNFETAVAADAGLRLLAAVGSVEAARAQLRTQVPDVLLVDLGLPDGNGIEL